MVTKLACKYWLAAIILVAVSGGSLHAQDYLTGKLVDPKFGPRDILYDRTQYAIGISIYQTVYKVMNTAQTPIYDITLTHDAEKNILYVALKKEGGESKGFTVRYDPDSSGLIFSNLNTADTAFATVAKYEYIVSFAETNRDYPILHKITAEEGKQLQLDPLSKLCLKRNAEVVRRMMKTNPVKPAPPRDNFAEQMARKKDSLNMLNSYYYSEIGQIRAKIEADEKKYFNENKIQYNEHGYRGEKRKGDPEGQGILVEDGNVRDGLFVRGGFSSGDADLKGTDGEYLGQFSRWTQNGVGWKKYPNGNFQLGIFQNGIFTNGVVLMKTDKGEIYFGVYRNCQRTGYGELRNSQGNCYYGEFLDGRLVMGYAREVDQFGYATYSRIEKGLKKTVDPQEAAAFFGTNLVVKK